VKLLEMQAMHLAELVDLRRRRGSCCERKRDRQRAAA
jgi:hypothetical protein